MKKQFLLKTMMLLCTLFVSIGAWAEDYNGTFVKITAASDLVTGYYVVVGSESASSNAGFAMGSSVSSGRMTGVAVAFDQADRTSITNPDDGIVWYVAVSGTTCTFKNMSTSTYLSNSSTTSGKGMSLAATSSNFTFDGYNTTSPIGFKFSSSQSSNNYIKYNASSQWFSNYASGYTTSMTPFRMYKLDESGAEKLGTPTGMTAGSITTSSARLSWSAVSNASSYKVKVGNTEYATSNTYYDLTELTQVSDYNWSVKAVGDGENYRDGDYCDALSFTTLANGSTFVIDFENAIDTYSDWTFTNISKSNATITAYKGSYFGTNSSSTTATITTKEKVLVPQYLKFYVSKATDNTTDCTWKVQVSEDGSEWIEVNSISGSSMKKGEWNTLGTDLSSYEEVYVRISYGTSGAVRAIDHITLVYSDVQKADAPVITPADGTEFHTATQEVSISAADGASIYYTLDGSTPDGTKTLYEGAFNISATTTVKAIAYETDKRPSAVVSATLAYVPNYNISCNAPEGGSYTVKVANNEAQTITESATIIGGQGKTITLTTTPSAGYKLASTPFTVKDADEAAVSVSKDGDNYTFTMPGKNVTITANYSRMYTITAGTFEHGEITAIKDKDGVEITETSYRSKVVVEASADAHWNLASMYYVKEGEESQNEITENEGVYSFTMPQSNVTVYATYTEDPKFNVSWVVNGTEVKAENLYGDVTVSAPEVDPIADKVFRGWVEDEIDTPQNEAPSYVNVSGLTVSADKTFHAVFATASGNASTNYSKITSMASLTDNDYVIAYDYNSGTQIAMGNTANGTDKINASALSLSDSKYANPDADYIWSIKKVSDGVYTLYNADADKYAKAISSGASLVDDPYNFTITWDNTNNCFRIQSTTNDTYYLHGYVNNTSYDFRSSTSGSGAKYHLHLYKNESTVSYSDYTTTVATSQAITTNENSVGSYVAVDALDFTRVDGLEAFVATAVTTNTITLAKVNKVPARTAFVVKGAQATATYNVPFTTATEILDKNGNVTTNIFLASDGNYTVEEGDFVYALAKTGSFKQVADGVTIPAGKAYIKSNVELSKALSLDFDDEVSSINGIENVNYENNAAYNLAGQRVNANTKGIIIVNGKKVLNK